MWYLDNKLTCAERDTVLVNGMGRPLSWLLAALLFMPATHAASPPDAAARASQAVVTTETFVRQAVALLKFEAASSQLALRKTRSDVVQGFARQLSLDYAAAGMKFRQAAADAKLKLPRDALDASHKALSDELAHTPPGKAFAKAYIEVQIKGLREDLEFFQAYAQSGDNERMKFFAQEMVPVLSGHLEQAEKLRR
jgi:putative membrane protein